MYEAVGYLFEETITNHASKVPSSPNYYNVSAQSPLTKQQQSSSSANKADHTSLVLLPFNNSSGSIQATATLPHANYNKINSLTNTRNAAVYQNPNHQRNLSMSNTVTGLIVPNGNPCIGARLHNFQNNNQQNRSLSNDVRLLDPACVIPLASFTNTAVKTPASNSKQRPHLSRFQTVNNSIRKNISDLPRLLRRNMQNQQKQQQQQQQQQESNDQNISTVSNGNDSSTRLAQSGRSLSAYYHNSKAMRLVASMKVKSASFKRSLFTQSVSEKSQIAQSSQSEASSTSGRSMEPKPSLILSASNKQLQAQANAIEMSTTSTSSASSSSSKAVDDVECMMMMGGQAFPSPNSTTKILPDKCV